MQGVVKRIIPSPTFRQPLSKMNLVHPVPTNEALTNMSSITSRMKEMVGTYGRNSYSPERSRVYKLYYNRIESQTAFMAVQH